MFRLTLSKLEGVNLECVAKIEKIQQTFSGDTRVLLKSVVTTKGTPLADHLFLYSRDWEDCIPLDYEVGKTIVFNAYPFKYYQNKVGESWSLTGASNVRYVG